MIWVPPEKRLGFKIPSFNLRRLVQFTMSHRMDSWIPVHPSPPHLHELYERFKYSCSHGSPFILLFLHPS